MRIEWTPPVRPASPRRDDKGGTVDRSFTLGGESVAGPASTQGAQSMSAIEGLLSLQEVPDPSTGRRRAVARGDKLLDELDALRLALLDGVLPRERLEGLARLAAEQSALVDDARLAEILGEIELRTAVELAKLDAVT
jgi:hypothetical protein